MGPFGFALWNAFGIFRTIYPVRLKTACLTERNRLIQKLQGLNSDCFGKSKFLPLNPVNIFTYDAFKYFNVDWNETD